MIARTVVEPEESAAEKIYATLRECREQADPKKQKGVKMQGYLVSTINSSDRLKLLGLIKNGTDLKIHLLYCSK
jgi:Ras GTPase-activating protein 1